VKTIQGRKLFKGGNYSLKSFETVILHVRWVKPFSHTGHTYEMSKIGHNIAKIKCIKEKRFQKMSLFKILALIHYFPVIIFSEILNGFFT
jgi:hypothetical protein